MLLTDVIMERWGLVVSLFDCHIFAGYLQIGLLHNKVDMDYVEFVDHASLAVLCSAKLEEAYFACHLHLFGS